ncbi:hypothetical protein [Dolosigranulum pigrum]|jgi:hypothetical protein|uniref:Uncharacterized protein n=1 Tax=Dolosigranulum pigrum TaxID=29394 RepID=A0A1S8KPQ6_9LACT|nr:hypothetical protein [Dolosigranulum pigrum]OOL81718.1 hypothetical protein BWX42_08445 [Dolosigranulum pigrum]RAN53022.1 hypothetical protein B8A31_04405 [Dolosigranulum pigrum]RAN65592.1 hypothetical protein B8A45_03190 [Dolosigranulum pigrum]
MKKYEKILFRAFYLFIGSLFFIGYWYFVEEYMSYSAIKFPMIVLTTYLFVSLPIFPFSVDRMEFKDDYGIRIHRIILPVLYILSPVILIYDILKNKNWRC